MTTAEVVTAIFAAAALILSVITIFYAGGQTKAARDAADAAKDQVDAAREQVSAADEQVDEMRRQTHLTLASIAPQLALEYTRVAVILRGVDGHESRPYIETHEWRLYNYGSAPALEVLPVLNWETDGVQYGQLTPLNIPGGEYRVLTSPKQELRDIADARELFGRDGLGANVSYKTITGVADNVFVTAIEQNKRNS